MVSAGETGVAGPPSNWLRQFTLHKRDKHNALPITSHTPFFFLSFVRRRD